MSPEELIQQAIIAQNRAIAPYSQYFVGAALQARNGDVILGCNIESKAYPSTMCAERVAIYSAISQGITKFKAIAIVSNIGAKPCGPCRQIIHEYLHDIPIYTSDGKNLDNYEEHIISNLLPHAFG